MIWLHISPDTARIMEQIQRNCYTCGEKFAASCSSYSTCCSEQCEKMASAKFSAQQAKAERRKNKKMGRNRNSAAVDKIRNDFVKCILEGRKRKEEKQTKV